MSQSKNNNTKSATSGRGVLRLVQSTADSVAPHGASALDENLPKRLAPCSLVRMLGGFADQVERDVRALLEIH